MELPEWSTEALGGHHLFDLDHAFEPALSAEAPAAERPPHFARDAHDAFHFEASSLAAEHGGVAAHRSLALTDSSTDTFVFDHDARSVHAAARPDTISEQVYKIAMKLESGAISASEANQKLQVLANKAWDPPGIPPTPGDLLVKAARYSLSDAKASAMAGLVEASFNNGGIGANQLNAALDPLFKEITTVSKGEGIDVHALVQVSEIALGFRTSSEAQVRAAFQTGAKHAGDFYEWAQDGIDALGGRSGMFSTNGSIKTYLALANTMADTVASGALVDYAIKDIKHGDMDVAKATEFVREFASLAMDNRGSRDYLPPGGQPSADLVTLKQIDGLDETNRSDLVMIQLVKDLHGANAKSALSYAQKNYFEGYLDGLGEYGLLVGGNELVRTLEEARKAIETTVSATIAKLSADGASATDLYKAAKDDVSSQSALYLAGIDAIGKAAALALGKDAPLGVGSAGVVAAYASDPSLDGFVKIGVSITEDALEIGNPLAKAELIANVADIILDQFALADIVGPFVAGTITGAIDVVQSISNVINNTIDAAIGLVVSPLVVFTGTVVLHAAENFSNLVEGLVTLNWNNVKSSAQQFGDEFVTDTLNVGFDITDSVLGAINAVSDAVDSIVEAAQAAINAARPVYDAVNDALIVVFGAIFGNDE